MNAEFSKLLTVLRDYAEPVIARTAGDLLKGIEGIAINEAQTILPMEPDHQDAAPEPAPAPEEPAPAPDVPELPVPAVAVPVDDQLTARVDDMEAKLDTITAGITALLSREASATSDAPVSVSQ